MSEPYYFTSDSTYISSITTVTSGPPIYITPTGGVSSLPVSASGLARKEKPKMRGLYEVYIVDSDTDEVVHQSGAFVAKDEDNASLKAVQQAGGTLTKDIDDYDIIVVELGDVRAKKEVRTVKVVKD